MKPRLHSVPTGPAAGPVHDPHCRSCGTAVIGKFCHHCSEAVHAHPPSVGEFAHEFIGHYVALEGKLWRTLKLLILRPGQLTTEFLHGRRVPFLEPLRLYLTLSLVFFALIKICGITLPQLTLAPDSVGMSYERTIHIGGSGKGREAVTTASATMYDKAGDAPEVRNGIAAVLSQLARVNTHWADNVRHFFDEPAQRRAERLNQGFRSNLPYMLIGALPLFALYLKLLYLRSGRRYGEHVLFAMHANAFALLAASVMIVLPGTAMWLLVANAVQPAALADYVQLLPLLALIVYLPLAMQRVYGGHWLATIARWLLLIGLHLTMIVALTMAAEFIGIAAHG
ncbi:DUF3667 domain-containing protein [Pseudoduganella violacea]|uniref:DUF3667 domain-containing protein n=1 Tax=Pseudoduganella violacea TaxID=1715466 RepID=A0A7W5BB63_9BURK|nr:DUF3667 domain-containing protein [Pseudoduganella violacea]MBB3119911.1 hypothetical protein [Pseudoduganella violacea]